MSVARSFTCLILVLNSHSFNCPSYTPNPPELSTDLTDRSRVVEDGWIRILLVIGSTEFRQDMTSTVGWVTKEAINSQQSVFGQVLHGLSVRKVKYKGRLMEMHEQLLLY